MAQYSILQNYLYTTDRYFLFLFNEIFHKTIVYYLVLMLIIRSLPGKVKIEVLRRSKLYKHKMLVDMNNITSTAYSLMSFASWRRLDLAGVSSLGRRSRSILKSTHGSVRPIAVFLLTKPGRGSSA